jgi:hypothetical protein
LFVILNHSYCEKNGMFLWKLFFFFFFFKKTFL